MWCRVHWAGNVLGQASEEWAVENAVPSTQERYLRQGPVSQTGHGVVGRSLTLSG
jgi:hypothetical protein